MSDVREGDDGSLFQADTVATAIITRAQISMRRAVRACVGWQNCIGGAFGRLHGAGQGAGPVWVFFDDEVVCRVERGGPWFVEKDADGPA